MSWLEAITTFISMLWEALKPYMPAVIGFGAGVEYQSGADAKQALKSTDEAILDANSVNSMSDADVLRYLQSLGAVRSVEGDKANSKPD